MRKISSLFIPSLLSALCMGHSAIAQQVPAPTSAANIGNTGWQFGAVLDVTHTTHALELGSRDQGLQLGHSDLSASGPIGQYFNARITGVAATEEGKLETDMEEAWVQTTALPAGLQARAGRFASQIGYLNQQHPHADDFVERPLMYRAFFGGHWNDDGVRLNWTAPTPFFLMLGAEALRGKRLVEETSSPSHTPGAATFVAKLGADLNESHSWQLGLSHVRNYREAQVESHEEEEGEHEEEGHEEHGTSGHDHSHAAQFSGGKIWMVDATWKWSPGGNNRNQQVRVGFEAVRVTDLNRYASSHDKHEGNALSLVWRFKPEWEVGARTDWLRVRKPHEDHFDSGSMRENALMLTWRPNHMQALRVQYTTQNNASGFENPAKRSVQLQYIFSFGAHGAHTY